MKRGRRFLGEAKQALGEWNLFSESGANVRGTLEELCKSPDEEVQKKLEAFDETFAKLKPDFFSTTTDAAELKNEIVAAVDKSLKMIITKAMESWSSPGAEDKNIQKFNPEPLAEFAVLQQFECGQSRTRQVRLAHSTPCLLQWLGYR